MHRTWYRLFDPDPSESGCVEILPIEAARWNSQGYGIFWSVNEFQGARSKASLKKINSWYFEIDKGPKAIQWQKIRAFLTPSLIVETRRGYQVYFDAQDATLENWDAIVSDRLLYYYQADPAVHDVTRILRVPGFYHCKDLQHPFLVREVFRSECIYREADLLSYFPLPQAKLRARRQRHESQLRAKVARPDRDLWARINEMDCQDALERLSGSKEVNFESFTFKRVGGGKLNIVVNGKMTACWIDADKHIGSRTRGGPTIYHWLRWYGYSGSRAMAILREYFPEVFNQEQRRA